MNLITMGDAGSNTATALLGAVPTCERHERNVNHSNEPNVAAGNIDDARINNAASEPGNWLAHGLTTAAAVLALTQINRDTVAKLGLAYELDVGSNDALEATPIVVDNTPFFTSTYSITRWMRSAARSWRYDPKVPKTFCARPAAANHRGVSVYQGNVRRTLDGRLAAVASNGEKVWEVVTPVIDRDRFYTITGAPKTAKGKVFIGNGGAEFGVRGYVTAMMPPLVNKSGASTRCLAIHPCPLSIRKWSWPRRPGKAARGGKLAEVAPFGIPLFMIRNSIKFTWALVTARRGLA